MTDGIIEAQNSEGKLYSESGRLEETISKFTLDLSAKAMVDAILNDVLLFSGDKTTRDDDMTVVVAKVMWFSVKRLVWVSFQVDIPAYETYFVFCILQHAIRNTHHA